MRDGDEEDRAASAELIAGLARAVRAGGDEASQSLVALVELVPESPAAKRELAKLLVDGVVEPPSWDGESELDAQDLLTEAYAEGDPEAPFVLAQLLERDGEALGSDDARCVRQLYADAAERGWIDAYTNLGWCLWQGLGGPVDVARAHELWSVAAEWGDPVAQANLGRDLELGIGTPVDRDAAERWYARASAWGFHDATLRLAGLMWSKESIESRTQAVRLWTRVFESEAPDAARGQAAYELGNASESGIAEHAGIEDAVRFYEAGAALGDELCLLHLGWLLYNGEGIARDPVRSVELYRRAANLGNVSAMYNLGIAHEDGEGVTRSEDDAIRWYRAAANAGHEASAEAAARIEHRRRSRR